MSERTIGTKSLSDKSYKVDLSDRDIKTIVYFKNSNNMCEVEDNSIQLILTSPPYYNLKDYSVLQKQKGQLSNSPENYHQTYDEYLVMLKSVFKECNRILKDSGILVVNIDIIRVKTQDKNIIPIPLHIIEICLEIGLGCKDIIIYKKLTGIPFQFGKKLKDRYEYLLLFSKTNDYKWNLDDIRIPYPENYIYPPGHKRRNPLGKAPSNIWEFYPPFQTGGKHHYHYCPFPYGLCDRCIKLFTDKNDTVLDPFLGSGQFLARAKFLKRNGIGYEINRDFADLIKSKISNIKIGTEEEISRLVDYTIEKNENNNPGKKVIKNNNQNLKKWILS